MLRNEQSDLADVVHRIRYISPLTEIIVVAPSGDQEEIDRADQAGAFDCIIEPISSERLLSRIQKAVQYRAIKAERGPLKEHVAMRYGFDNVVGISKVITEIKETIGRIAPTDIPIMITGASGTGKELVARVVHHHSHRRKHELVIVDCALPENLLDVQLFESDLDRSELDRPAGLSLLERADGGTLVLDKVECMPESIQERLYAFLNDFTINHPDGQSRRLDIRFVTISGVDLNTDDAKDKFNQELLDRLSTIAIKMPRLIERAEDIEILTEFFLRTIASEYGDSSKTITRPAVDRLLHHGWPGNVRELENTIRRAVALCSKDQLDIDDISFVGVDSAGQTASEQKNSQNKTVSRLDDNQRSLIQRALAENEWNYTQTAQELGIGRTTLWRKVKKYNLKKEAKPA